MLYKEDFESQAFKNQAQKIHAEVLLILSAHLKSEKAWCHRKTGDQSWLLTQEVKDALKVLRSLDACLKKGNLDIYLEQHAILWGLLEELELVLLAREKIAKQFGKDCFFINFERR